MTPTIDKILFESYVILDTTKTTLNRVYFTRAFESYVILDTTKTIVGLRALTHLFESYVILDTTKTPRPLL